jgi:hypothetical protein
MIPQDEALLRAEELAQMEINDMIARAKTKRWNIVAKNLHKILKKDFKYSARSCQKRFIALMNDMATIPPEIDDDPGKRQEEKAARTLAKLHDRHLQEVTEKQQKEQKRLSADQERLRKALEKKERADRCARAAEEKARAAMQQAAIRDEKAKQLEADRARKEAQIQVLRQVRDVPTPSPRKPLEKPHPSTGPSTPTAPTFTPTPSTTGTSTGKAKRTPAADLDDPRARLTTTQLVALCTLRGIPKSGTKPAVVKRLAVNDMNMGMDALKALLHSKQIPTNGTVEELAKRLAQTDAQASAWGKKHLEAMDTFWDRSSSSSATAEARSNKRVASPEPNGSNPKRVRSGGLIDATGVAEKATEGSGAQTSASESIAAKADSDLPQLGSGRPTDTQACSLI